MDHPLLDIAAAAKLPPNILFGTSSWCYEGWKKIVYHESYHNSRDFRRRALAEYARIPWFRTVGIDSSFYKPLSVEELQHYSGQLPNSYRWVSKVWEQITVARWQQHKRYGEKAGRENPDFLNNSLFCERVLEPYRCANLESRCGVFVFEFQTMKLNYWKGVFLERLKLFLKSLPRDFCYAVEVRNREFVGDEYFNILNSCGITHCFNHWSFMPSLREQMTAAAIAGGLEAPFYVARILTPLGLTYKQAVERFKPYDRIQEPLLEMRRDLITLARRAITKRLPLYILINNRAEGCAPLTIAEVGKQLVSTLTI